MKLTTKGDLALAALRKAVVASNATLVDTEPQSVEDAITDLELMLAEWRMTDADQRGLDLGYAFSADGVTPAPEDRHNLPDFALNAVILTLATRIIPDYGQEPPATLVTKAQFGKERLAKWLSKRRTPCLRYPARMPIGSGNHITCGSNFYGVTDDAGGSNTDK